MVKTDRHNKTVSTGNVTSAFNLQQQEVAPELSQQPFTEQQFY